MREPDRRPGSISLFSRPKFAHENRVHWLCGQPCANHAGAWALFPSFPGSKFAHENRIHWLCGQPCANHTAARALFPPFPGSKFALKNRIHWLCGQASANPVPPAGARASGKSLAQKRKAAISKSKSLLPLFWGLIDRILFLYGFIRYETPAVMLSSCEGSLPGLHMRTGTVRPFP